MLSILWFWHVFFWTLKSVLWTSLGVWRLLSWFKLDVTIEKIPSSRGPLVYQCIKKTMPMIIHMPMSSWVWPTSMWWWLQDVKKPAWASNVHQRPVKAFRTSLTQLSPWRYSLVRDWQINSNGSYSLLLWFSSHEFPIRYVFQETRKESRCHASVQLSRLLSIDLIASAIKAHGTVLEEGMLGGRRA